LQASLASGGQGHASRKKKGAAIMDDRMFIILFFPSFLGSLGLFFVGVGYLWSVAIRNREAKKGPQA
jgi:hypothetical protein